MPAAVPVPIRQAMFRRRERGATVAELSQAFGVAPRTVRNLLRRWRGRGEGGIAPDYRRPPDPPPTPDHPAFGPALLLRQQHPRWGGPDPRLPGQAGGRPAARRPHAPALVPPGRPRPGPAGAAARPPRPGGPPPPTRSGRSTPPRRSHLGDGGRACWLRVADEFTGAVLHTAVFPPRALECGARRGHPGAAPGGVRSAGACRAPSGSITARPGARPATCRRTWRCG